MWLHQLTLLTIIIHRLIEVILETDLCISVCLFRHFHCFILSLFLTWNTGVVLLFMNLYVHSFLIIISICLFFKTAFFTKCSADERSRDVFYLFSLSFFVTRTLFGIIMNALPYHNNYWFVQCCSSLIWNYRAILFFITRRIFCLTLFQQQAIYRLSTLTDICSTLFW